MNGSLENARLAYARTMGMAARDPGGPIEAAFAAVPRECFLGKGPWRISSSPDDYRPIATDPAELYRDVLVALLPEKRINNGQPSLHALCLSLLQPQPGETVVHIGAGTGYYTAILSTLVGDGEVHAYEIEPPLAERASENLRGYPNVRVHATSAAQGALPCCNIVYVNAGVTHPLASWLDALRPGGRLLFPMTGASGNGAMTRITRTGDSDVFAAQILIPVGFVPCTGARDASSAEVLAQALAGSKWQSVSSLRRDYPPDETC